MQPGSMVGSEPTRGGSNPPLPAQQATPMGGVPVHSVVLQTSREGFDSLSVHASQHARVAQMAEATRSDRGGWGFESLAGYTGPVSPVEWTPPRQGGDRRFESGTGRAWKGGRVVHGVVLLRRTGRKAGAGSNPAPSATPLLRYPCGSTDEQRPTKPCNMQVRILSGVRHRSPHNGGWRPVVGNQS